VKFPIQNDERASRKTGGIMFVFIINKNSNDYLEEKGCPRTWCFTYRLQKIYENPQLKYFKKSKTEYRSKNMIAKCVLLLGLVSF